MFLILKLYLFNLGLYIIFQGEYVNCVGLSFLVLVSLKF